MRSILYPLLTLSVCISLFAFQSASAQYCVDNLYFYDCVYGDDIDNISVGSINQTGTSCGPNGYSDFTNLSSDFEQGSTYTLQLTTNNYGNVISMWIDFNDDGTFASTEKLISYFFCNSANTSYSMDFTIPWNVTLGNHRMRVRDGGPYAYPFPFDACVQMNFGEVHDYTANIIPPSAMSYVSGTTTQTVTTNAPLGTNDVPIIGIEVVTSGSLNPVSATSFTLNNNGTTNPSDVTNYKVYYTGSDANFAATNLFGSAPNLSAPVTGNQPLVQGVNYFWVAYDISPAATIGDYIDAECTSVTVGGSSHTPTITAPAGNRQLGYCTPVSTFGCYTAYIDGVVLNTLSNLVSYCNGNVNGYINYSPVGNMTTSLEIGSSYPITLSAPFYAVGFGVWIDFNNDGDFGDAGEFVFASPSIMTGDQTGTVAVPNNPAYIGDHRMRVRATSFPLITSDQSCSTFSYGETEDYTITLGPASPMTFVSSTTTQDNISFVQKGTNDVEIIGIQVVTSGAVNPFDVTSITINSNGTTNPATDVTNYKIYYTGSSSTFATTTLFGSSTDISSPITGNATLSGGTNYFWVAYDVPSTATIGNELDAQCTEIVMTGNGGTQVPDITAPAGLRQIDYCVPVNQYGCFYGYIDGVVLNSLSNVFSGCNGNIGSYIQYAPVGNLTTSLELGGTYSISLTGMPGNYDYTGFGVWVDFNNDGDFNDAGEFAWSSPTYGPGTQIGTISVPATASLGDIRMRIRSSYYGILSFGQSCGETFNNGESEDYTITITPQTNMSYVSSTVTQDNTTPVSPGETNAEIISVQILTLGSLNPFNATTFQITENGSTDFLNDVSNVRIWYTGSDPAFSTATLFGSSTTLPADITGNQVLVGGTNYFWVTYEVAGNATLGDFLDAECTQIVMTGAGGTQTPLVTAPAGNRLINLCTPTYGTPCSSGDYIDDITLNTLSNLNTGCNGNVDNYINYPPSGNLTTNLQSGSSYTIQLTCGPTFEQGFGVWIDFNNNSNFGDPGEFVYASPGSGFSFTGTVTIPVDPSFYGDRKMRVRCAYSTSLGADDYCTGDFFYGETEDYTITIDPPPACTGTPVAGTITPDQSILCGSGDINLILAGFTPASGLTFQWQNSPDGSTWANIPGATNTSYSATVSSSTYYEVVVNCTNSGSFSTSASVFILVGGNGTITSTTGATVCGEGVVDLSATGDDTYVIWYDSPTSTSPLYTSSSPSTYSPYVNATTDYYVAAADGATTTGHVGPPDYNIGFPVTYYYNVGEYFDVLKEDTLVGVYVYPADAGDVILQLNDQNYGGQIALITFPVSVADINQKTFIPIDVPLSVGNNYYLTQSGGVSLYSDDFAFPAYDFPYTLDDVISITQSSYGVNFYFSVYDWVVKYATLCESTRTPVTATVTASPEITVTPNPADATICDGSGLSIALDVTGGAYTSFTWAPSNGLSGTVGASITASPSQSTQYIVTATDGSCTNLDTVVVHVALSPDVSVTAFPDAICAGGSSQLNAVTSTGYSVMPIPFAPDPTIGGTTVTLSDDQVSNGLPLGFSFNFYGNDYSQFYLGSNGFLTFTSTFASGCCEGQLLPDPDEPNNLIAFAWEDLYPPAGGTIRYYTTGTAPYRKCVVEYKDIMHYPSPGADPITIQIIMYETTNYIEIHTTSMPGNPSDFWAGHTEGIENSDGTLALAVPGRNSDATWTATNDAWLFIPPQTYTYNWSPGGTLDNASIANPMATPIATTTYTVTVTNAVSLCSTTDTVTVNMTSTPVAGTVTPGLTDFCGSGSTVLDVTGYTPGATLQWGQSSTSGGPYTDIAGETNDSYTTPSLNSTTYYAATATCINSSTSTEGAVQVNQPPLAPTGVDGVNCGPGVITLGATGSGNGDLNWYYSQNGNNYLGSGSPFTTPYINQTTTFYVEEGGPPAPPLPTTYSGFYSSNGSMFDITALNDIFITGFDVNMESFYNSDFEVYYKVGTYVGSEYSPQNWTLLGVAPSVQGLGYGVPTPVPMPSLAVAAGQTIGIYITAASYYSYIYNSYGSQIGNVYASDNNVQIKEGSQFYYPFSYGYGPYVWNGTLHYVTPGCASDRTPVLAEIVTPQVTATASVTTVCEGDPVTLVAVNFGPQNFDFEWMPQLPGMLPQNGLNDTVTVSPTVSTTFTVSISDPSAPGCDTIISIPITVNPTPGVFISNLDPAYYDNVTSVILTGIPPGGTFSGPGVTGNVFNPNAVGPGVYVLTYTYTDANGCTGSSQQQVKVLHFTGIVDVEIDKNISLFPNPSEGLFNMSIKLPSAVNSVMVTIYDDIGRQVFFNDYGAVQSEMLSTFDFTHAAKQSYYVTINVDGLVFYRKVTIQ